jgi:hypothetical protein
MVLLTAVILFDFYGAAVWSDGGPIAHQMSVLSVLVCAPAMMIAAWFLVERTRVRRQL